MMDFTGKYKWNAWKANEGKSQEQAKKEYVDALLAVSFASVARTTDRD
jgi:diazepam-binding inhibitor (GABA receptor modulating acyl-CoA-binding protein)